MTDEMKMPENITFEIIRREDLQPGDFVLVKCQKENAVQVAEWAHFFFKGTQTKVCAVPDNIDVSIVRQNKIITRGGVN